MSAHGGSLLATFVVSAILGAIVAAGVPVAHATFVSRHGSSCEGVTSTFELSTIGIENTGTGTGQAVCAVPGDADAFDPTGGASPGLLGISVEATDNHPSASVRAQACVQERDVLSVAACGAFGDTPAGTGTNAITVPTTVWTNASFDAQDYFFIGLSVPGTSSGARSSVRGYSFVTVP
jgi:hypothetical protein